MQTLTNNTILLLKLNLWLVINITVGLVLFLSPNIDFIFLALITVFSGNILLPKPLEKVDLNKKLNRKELLEIAGIVCVLIFSVCIWEFFKPYTQSESQIFVQVLAAIIMVTACINYIKHLRSKKYNKPIKQD